MFMLYGKHHSMLFLHIISINTIQKLSGKGLKMTAHNLNLVYIYLTSCKLHVMYY